ncbi:MAG: sensor histidine kinase, partial [Nonomuraea sp.]|nr:sensor histidine kinase [Nonomuraea sp.]
MALWPTLPWRPVAGWRRVTSIAYVMGSIGLGLLAFNGSHLPLILLGIASIAFQYGVRTGALVLAAVFLAMIAVSLPFTPGMAWVDVLVQALLPMLVFSAFVLGMVSAVVEARRRREEAQSLLRRVRELAVAEERARMARDMHDSVGHHLTVIKMGLENAERYRERDETAAWHDVRQAKQLTVEALAETRRWVRALKPLALDGAIGSAALCHLADSFSGTGVQVAFDVEGEERALAPDAELVLYRSLQEGLTNALRHARATEV